MPTIQCLDRPLPEITEDALSALVAKNVPPTIFRYNGKFAKLEHGKVVFSESDRMKFDLARVADYKNNKRFISPPKDLVDDIITGGPDERFPELVEVVSVPVLAPDGFIILDPGYHVPSGIYYHDTGVGTLPPIPASPSGTTVVAAIDSLTEPLRSFPFLDDSSKSHAIALMLQPFVRQMIDGSTPIFAIDAPAPGTGKTLLAKVLADPFLGRDVDIHPPCGTEEEWRKRILSALLTQPSHVTFDNIQNLLESQSLASVVTNPKYSDRLLGSPKTITVDVNCSWIITGNNLHFSRELDRRAVWIKLDAGPNPGCRGGFKHPLLMSWVRDHRGELVHAALTLIQAWIDAGKPRWTDREPDAKPLGSFEAWSEVMGGILSVADVPGFLTDSRTTPGTGLDEASLIRFADTWAKQHGRSPVGVKEVYSIAEDIGLDLGMGTERSRKIKLGKQLVKRAGTTVGSWRIVKGGEKARAKQFTLKQVS